MAVKIYRSGGFVILENVPNIGDIQAINPSKLDWTINVSNGIYTIRDGVQNQSYELGIFSNIQNENGAVLTSDSDAKDWLNSISSGVSKLGTNDLSLDAWGRPKFITDRSILHGLFTFNVPVLTWKEVYNGTERVPTLATSVNSKLSLKSGATLNDVCILETFRNPRYEPNRGHLYSTACFLPSKTAAGIRDFGIFTEEAGVFFRLKSDGNLYAVIRTTINSLVEEREQLIDTTGIDIEKGNVYDIQFQWRGVGNYKFFINLKQVYEFKLLGTLVELSMSNPALPISFRCENLGANVEINCGCVDVTSEGGSTNGKTYGSVSIDNQAGQVAVSSGYNVPVIAIRSKKTVSGLRNTRDTLALLLSAYSDQRSFMRIWLTRDFTAITENDQSWRDFGDGHLEFITYDNPDVITPMSFDIAKATVAFGCRVDQDNTYSTSALFEGRTNIWITPGDMLVCTIHRENGLAFNGGCVFEFAEEI